METMLSLVIYVLILGAVCWLIWWLITYLGIPEPFSKIARGVVAVVAVVLLIGLLLQFLPGSVTPFKLK